MTEHLCCYRQNRSSRTIENLLSRVSLAAAIALLMLQAAPQAMAQSSSGTQRGLEVVATENAPKLWALLVGVDDYVVLQDLRFAGRDVQMLRKRLVSSGFSEDRVFLLSSRETKPATSRFDRTLLNNLTTCLVDSAPAAKSWSSRASFDQATILCLC